MSAKATSYSYFKRFVAFLVDWYVSTFIAAIPIYLFQSLKGKDLVILNQIDNLPFPEAVAATVLALIIYVLYFCVFPLRNKNKKGQTLGRRLLKLDLVKTDGSTLTFKDLFIRDFLGVLLLQGNITTVNIYIMSIVQMLTKTDIIPYYQTFYTAVLIVSLVLLFTKKKQTLHDIMSRTIMTLAE